MEKTSMNRFNKILIPTDGSENTKSAIAQGLELAKAMGSEVTALYVVDQASFVNFPMDASVFSIYPLLEKEGKEAVDYVIREGEKAGVKVEGKVVEGNPAKKIVDEAENYDLVVMGTLGRTGISKLLLGSVAERVVRLAPCPVLVVRTASEAEEK